MSPELTHHPITSSPHSSYLLVSSPFFLFFRHAVQTLLLYTTLPFDRRPIIGYLAIHRIGVYHHLVNSSNRPVRISYLPKGEIRFAGADPCKSDRSICAHYRAIPLSSISSTPPKRDFYDLYLGLFLSLLPSLLHSSILHFTSLPTRDQLSLHTHYSCFSTSPLTSEPSKPRTR